MQNLGTMSGRPQCCSSALVVLNLDPDSRLQADIFHHLYTAQHKTVQAPFDPDVTSPWISSESPRSIGLVIIIKKDSPTIIQQSLQSTTITTTIF